VGRIVSVGPLSDISFPLIEVREPRRRLKSAGVGVRANPHSCRGDVYHSLTDAAQLLRKPMTFYPFVIGCRQPAHKAPTPRQPRVGALLRSVPYALLKTARRGRPRPTIPSLKAHAWGWSRSRSGSALRDRSVLSDDPRA
jgi:hypothetical protein